ncbi:MAG: hypothetical protein JWM99_1343 [Verrucomicrobiales bacterium]|nr:hypothetical protein [Verrucomicrobiales bacterium]
MFQFHFTKQLREAVESLFSMLRCWRPENRIHFTDETYVRAALEPDPGGAIQLIGRTSNLDRFPIVAR